MILTRYCYGDEATLGRLTLGDVDGNGTVLHTIERPWVPGMPGGMPFVSCLPDGDYQLLPHVRPNGDYVLALRNPDLSVWYSTRNVPAEGGRSLILLHAANYASQVQGCIAPGMGRTVIDNRAMVTHSRKAMAKIMDYYEAHEPDEIRIVPTTGTS